MKSNAPKLERIYLQNLQIGKTQLRLEWSDCCHNTIMIGCILDRASVADALEDAAAYLRAYDMKDSKKTYGLD